MAFWHWGGSSPGELRRVPDEVHPASSPTCTPLECSIKNNETIQILSDVKNKSQDRYFSINSEKVNAAAEGDYNLDSLPGI